MLDPLVSILIPTRNRATVLSEAITSALNQTYPNIEIVVSDNCSQDQTREILAAIRDPRVRVVRTPSYYSMVRSWQFGFDQTRGQYVTFLCDDDGFVPDAIATAIETLRGRSEKIATWLYCNYFPEKNQLQIPIATGRVRSIQVEPILHRFFRGEVFSPWPQLTNALYQRDLLTSESTGVSNLFSAHAGDYFSGMLALKAETTYIHVDRPLTIFRVWSQSYSCGIATNRLAGEPSANDGEVIDDTIPLKDLQLSANYFGSNKLRTWSILRQTHPGLNWDWAFYFQACRNEIRGLERFGRLMEREWERYHVELARQSAKVQAAVAASDRVSLIKMLMNWIRQVPILGTMHGWLKTAVRGPESFAIDGASIGCHSLLEFTHRLSSLISTSAK